MDKEEQPLVSVIMPAYNSEKYIGQAIESVFKQEGGFIVELIVINDASSDHTRDAVQNAVHRLEQNHTGSTGSCTLVYIENKNNQGVAESRNIGIRKANGKYLAFLDADDWWSLDKLKKQVELMERTDAVLCGTGRELMNPDGTERNRRIGIPLEITYDMLLRTNSIPCSSVLAKTQTVREFYMCHDELHEDYILWLRILKKYGKVYGINEPLLKSRLSDGGKSRNKLKSAKMHYGVYRYLGYGWVKSFWYFIQYAWNGVRKYM